MLYQINDIDGYDDDKTIQYVIIPVKIDSVFQHFHFLMDYLLLGPPNPCSFSFPDSLFLCHCFGVTVYLKASFILQTPTEEVCLVAVTSDISKTAFTFPD